MGTTTIFLRMNDQKKPLSEMKKEELIELDNLGFQYEKVICGWRSSFELHNGNVCPLIFWKGRLIKLEDAPKLLNKKYYDKYTGKIKNIYEWTLLKRLILNKIEYLDKEFQKQSSKNKSKKKTIK